MPEKCPIRTVACYEHCRSDLAFLRQPTCTLSANREAQTLAFKERSVHQSQVRRHHRMVLPAKRTNQVGR